MNVEEVIHSRRTIHEFKLSPVPERLLIQEAISLARWAPNHHLTEPWHFYLLGKETIQSVCELNTAILVKEKGKEVAEHKQKRWANFPGWMVVTCEKSDDKIRFMEDFAACCCAVQNMMLYLWNKGVGMKWSTAPIIRDERFYNLIRINKDVQQIVGLFWYGYPVKIAKMLRKSGVKITTELP